MKTTSALSKENISWLKIILSVLLASAMLLFIAVTSGKLALEEPFCTAVLFSFVFLLALLPFIFSKSRDYIGFLFIAACIAGLIYIRVCLLFYHSSDYSDFLSGWVESLRKMTFREALSASIGDYNVPYLYVLTVISRFSAQPLVFIKAFSCAFDVLLAYYVMKILSLKTGDERLLTAAYLLTLAIPTVFLNSAYWGQCDSVYAALCLGSFFCALNGKGRPTVILWALAFSFKLQSIFLLPAFIIIYIVKKIKIRYLLWLPTVFFITIIPSLLAGKGFLNCIAIYYKQTTQYPRLFLNAPTVWQLFGNADFIHFNYVGIFLAGFAVLFFVYLCLRCRSGITEKNLVYIFYISALMLPYLLPRMHERYFFIADVLAVVLFFYDRKKWYIPLVTIFSSFATYVRFNMGDTITDQKYLSVALLILIIISLKELFTDLWERVPLGEELTPGFLKND